MKKTIIIIIALFSIFLLNALEPSAITITTKGDITLTHLKNTARLKKADLLYNEDELTSADKSFAAFKFIDGSGIIKLFPNSDIIINTKKEGGKLSKNTFISKGSLLSKVNKHFGVFDVETPTTVASIKGTKFYLQYLESGETVLYTIEGSILFSNKMNGKSAYVHKGEVGKSNGSGEIIVKKFSPKDLPKGVNDQFFKENKTLNIQMRNANGDIKQINIELE